MSAPRRLAFTIVATLACGHAGAADLDVLVSDGAGKPLAGAVVTLESSTGTLPFKPMPTAELAQRGRAFTPQVMVVTTGTPVNFPNFDTVRHHVYSFSPAKTFELKLYAGVPNAPIAFDKPGVVTMGCNIHDRMTAYVVVVSTPFHDVSVDGGRAHLADVPAGSYRLRVWHPGMVADAPPMVLPVKMGATGMEQAVQLAITSNPLGQQK